MSNRLKQIWSGFETSTTRHLTGGGVENILVPPRSDYSATDEAFLPENYNAPAAAAFSALRDNLGKKAKNLAGKQNDAAKLPSEAEEHVAATAFSAAGDDLIRGLRATAMRVERPEIDYAAFLESKVGKAHYKKHKRKKRFGLF